MNNNDENQNVGCVKFSENLGRKLAFLLIGGGIGAAVALLFAPKPGREIREDIADLATEGYDQALRAASEMKHRTAELYDTAKETGRDVRDVVSTGASAIRKEVTSDVQKIRSIVGATRKSGYARPGIF